MSGFLLQSDGCWAQISLSFVYCYAGFESIPVVSPPPRLPSQAPPSQPSHHPAFRTVCKAQDKRLSAPLFKKKNSLIIQPLSPECLLCLDCPGACTEGDAQTGLTRRSESELHPRDWVSFFPAMGLATAEVCTAVRCLLWKLADRDTSRPRPDHPGHCSFPGLLSRYSHPPLKTPSGSGIAVEF